MSTYAAFIVVLTACTDEAQPKAFNDSGQAGIGGEMDTTQGDASGAAARIGSDASFGNDSQIVIIDNVDSNTIDAGMDGAVGMVPTVEDSAVRVDGSEAGESICGTADENDIVTLSCPAGEIIDQVVFAGYGNPSGDCGSFIAGTCDATTAVMVVEGLCIGRASCTVPATNATFGDPCQGTVKSLSVEVRCVIGTPTAIEKPFKGVANSPCAVRTALGVSWYYNWGQTENEPCSDGRGGQFVPMIWGHPGPEQNANSIASSVASFVSRGYEYVLGFNEPDNPDQSDIPVPLAIELWPAFDNPAIKVVSPGTAANANPGQAWFTDFMTQLNNDPNLRSDVLAIHWYGWNPGSCDANARALENYINWAEGFAGGRPIWITEWGCLNQSAPNEETVINFYKGALEVFARHPRIERYAWYPWSSNCGLANPDGSLTALGIEYAAAPATK